MDIEKFGLKHFRKSKTNTHFNHLANKNSQNRRKCHNIDVKAMGFQLAKGIISKKKKKLKRLKVGNM